MSHSRNIVHPWGKDKSLIVVIPKGIKDALEIQSGEELFVKMNYLEKTITYSKRASTEKQRAEDILKEYKT
jgi:hypothetical protein